MTHTSLYLGLISGTSVDGIDAALVRFEPSFQVIAATTTAYPNDVRERILALTTPDGAISLDAFGELDVFIGECFADAALALLRSANICPENVCAIGSHGQTIRHRPANAHPFSLQIGDPNVIAERTGLTTVADFRRADIAAGGQGAPLVPAFHAAIFGHPGRTRVIVNLGGIANITVLKPGQPVLGYDTGPANCLLDAWTMRHLGKACDHGGAWAKTGHVDASLLMRLLSDPYFSAPAPKSTGREYFNLDWLEQRINARSPPSLAMGENAGVRGITHEDSSTAQSNKNLVPQDVQATLIALTTQSIAEAIHKHSTDEVLVCGGGGHNPVLMAALTNALVTPAADKKPSANPPYKNLHSTAIPVHSTAVFGVDPDFVEAAAFAWMARERLENRPGNLPTVTGARGFRILGGIYAPH